MPAESQLALIKQQLQTLEGLKLIYLFGSRAGGQVLTESDWDLAVLADTHLDSVERWQLAQNLASELGCDLDLVDLTTASTVIRMQVVSTGQLIFGEQYDADVFETQVYSMYGRLQESRQDIVQDFIGSLNQKSIKEQNNRKEQKDQKTGDNKSE